MRVPSEPPGHVLFEHFWVEVGSQPPLDAESLPAGGRFVVTSSVSMHLRNLARAVLLRSYPILLQVGLQRSSGCMQGDMHWLLQKLESHWQLEKQRARLIHLPLGNCKLAALILLDCCAQTINTVVPRNLLREFLLYPQGPTSSGKTTLVAHLAAKTGHRCIRINNHEGTDLQEYLGSYVTDSRGRLAFQEGALVTALRQGHWVVLDELNLAPSEVLEALNRWALPKPGVC